MSEQEETKDEKPAITDAQLEAMLDEVISMVFADGAFEEDEDSEADGEESKTEAEAESDA